MSFVFQEKILYIIVQGKRTHNCKDWNLVENHGAGGEDPSCSPRTSQWNIPVPGLSNGNQRCGATVQIYTGSFKKHSKIVP